jgi:hypothetical protein
VRENDVRESLDGSSADEHGFQCLRSGEKLTPLAGERYNLFSLAAGTKVLSNFLERPTETPGRVECTEAQHRVIALFDSAMILLDPPI